MAIRVSSTQFFSYLASQSTTRVSKVREAKKMMLSPRDDYVRMDYWLPLREASVALLTGKTSAREFQAAVSATSDPKKLSNYSAAASGLQKWLGRKQVRARSVPSQVWAFAGLEVVVAPELVLTWPAAGKCVVKLYFSAEPLSKYKANPMLRLLEQTHGNHGVAAILDTQQCKLFRGPTLRPQDLDILLETEAASFVRIWSQL